MKFTKKPVTIEAIQWTGENLREVICFTDSPPDVRHDHAAMKWEEYCDLVARDGLKIFTLEGKMNAAVGDWIIKGVKGEQLAYGPAEAIAKAILSYSGTDPSAQGGVPEITDEQIIGVLHSLAIDTRLSAYEFEDLQVAGTNVPGMKGVVQKCIACLQSGAWPAPMYSFDSGGNVVRAASPSPAGDTPAKEV